LKQQPPLKLGSLAAAGMTVVGALVVGLAAGLLIAKYAHWEWAVPVGLLLGFIGGLISMFRQISTQL
jgi:F0F1-type ATP synthase assembly protein I